MPKIPAELLRNLANLSIPSAKPNSNSNLIEKAKSKVVNKLSKVLGKKASVVLPPGWSPTEHLALLKEASDASRSILSMDKRVEFGSARGKLAALMLSKAKNIDFSDDADVLNWIRSVLEWRRSNHAYSTALDIVSIPDEFTIAITGDWGTGMYGAQKSVASINTSGADMFLHLGDIYYSGQLDEVRSRFIVPCSGLTNISLKRACNGNHEMYSGGDGYFEDVFKAFNQKSSFFILQNSHFVLFGIDTAYDEDFDLKDKILAGNLERDDFPLLTSQFAQIKEYASRLENAKKDVIIFSHHYPFSILDSDKIKILELAQDQLGKDFIEKRLRAWIFGHEHRCIRYLTSKKIPFEARCYGNGGVPQSRGKNASAKDAVFVDITGNGLEGKALDGKNQDIVGFESEYIPHTYTLLRLQRNKIREEIYLSNGTSVYNGAI